MGCELNRRRLLTGIVLALVVSSPLIGLAIGQTRRLEAYGDTPGLGVRYDTAPGRSDCQLVIAVTPKAHFNWLGQVWQDSDLHWQAIRIEGWAGEEWVVREHGQSGPVRVGHSICQLDKSQDWRWVYIPDEKTLVLDPV